MSFMITRLSLLPPRSLPPKKPHNPGTVLTLTCHLNSTPSQHIITHLLPPTTTKITDLIIRQDTPGTDLDVTLIDGRRALINFSRSDAGLVIRGNLGGLCEVDGQPINNAPGRRASDRAKEPNVLKKEMTAENVGKRSERWKDVFGGPTVGFVRLETKEKGLFGGRRKLEVAVREDGVLLVRGVEGTKWYVDLSASEGDNGSGGMEGKGADGGAGLREVLEVGIALPGLRPVESGGREESHGYPDEKKLVGDEKEMVARRENQAGGNAAPADLMSGRANGGQVLQQEEEIAGGGQEPPAYTRKA
jgi:hypothetical protein